jgi:hypothetical protein
MAPMLAAHCNEVWSACVRRLTVGASNGLVPAGAAAC